MAHSIAPVSLASSCRLFVRRSQGQGTLIHRCTHCLRAGLDPVTCERLCCQETHSKRQTSRAHRASTTEAHFGGCLLRLSPSSVAIVRCHSWPHPVSICFIKRSLEELLRCSLAAADKLVSGAVHLAAAHLSWRTVRTSLQHFNQPNACVVLSVALALPGSAASHS